MDDAVPFGATLGIVCLVGLLAVLSNRLSTRLRVPAPAFFLVGAAVASDLVPALGGLGITTVQRLVTVALVVILFDGGMHIGAARFRSAAGAIVWLGVAGTVVTAAALAAAAHRLFGFDWYLSLLLGTALAPTDPAVVFSVLGRREISGPSGVLLEGESGANDPVGIALLVAILSAGTAAGWGAIGTGLLVFALQMVVGAVVGLVGGRALLVFMRRVPLPSEGLYPLRVLASAGVVFGVATVLQGSGFLAVFVAGIVLGDERAPYKREIERFHSALASLAEIVAFTLLGLTVQLRTLPDGRAWSIGLVLAVLMAFVVRPVLVGLVLLPVRMTRGERVFVLWSGLKGAVPVLLGTYILTTHDPGALRVYDVVFVVVLFSVVVSGGLVPWLATRLGLPMRVVEPEPWALGLRFRDEPQGMHRFTVAPGAPADGASIEALPMGENAWVSFVSRAGALVQVRGETVLEAGDELLVLAEPDVADEVEGLFTAVPAGPPDVGAEG
ncbi:cation:proton antiporter [Kineosporia sp. R_H_3]|uniref:cation:proton antiporter domain-containing protein n=1 Tax=Kineosporia sp. R_H_3 TaxID=1961848 RepID=UPI000B4B54DD|nr:cation:proton antiporter [Kineosporia sp. R_H_3]